MLILKIVRVNGESASGALSLPLSVIDYINQKKGAPRLERVCGMLLLKNALSELGVDSYELDLLPSGKPVLRGSELHFNVSHAGGLCALAISDSPVGIDLQNLSALDRISDLSKFAERFLTPDERAIFSEEPTKERLCRLWTRKEALVKLLGRTLGNSLSQFSSFCCDDVTFEHRRAKLDGDIYLLTIAKAKKQQIPNSSQ